MLRAEITLEEKEGKGRTKSGAIIIAIIILVVIIGAVWLQSSKYAPVTVGAPAPEFTLADRNGKEYSLSSLRGKVVFVNFWATWCKSCKEEMPSMQALYSYMKERDMPFEMLAISMDRVTTQKGIEPFAKSLGLTFPILLDAWGRTDGKYKLTGVPETYIIDRNGNVAEKIAGPRDWTTIEAVKKLFALLDIQPTQQSSGG